MGFLPIKLAAVENLSYTYQVNTVSPGLSTQTHTHTHTRAHTHTLIDLIQRQTLLIISMIPEGKAKQRNA